MSKFDKDGFYSPVQSGENPVKETMVSDVRKCPSGAIRDNRLGKGRMDLLPGYALLALQSTVDEDVFWPDATMEVAKVFEKGAMHYADRNWEQGMYVDWFLDSGQRHLEKAMAGWYDEPHLFMSLWNLLCLVDTVERVQKGVLEEEYLGHFINLNAKKQQVKIDKFSLSHYSINTLLYLTKFHLYHILAKGETNHIYYAAIFLFEVADRFTKAVRTKSPNCLGVLLPLYDKEGACV